ncbi:MAG: Nramp family divalent metal transporter [Planctomycetaceae bacterium]
MSQNAHGEANGTAELPQTFGQYLRSFGPGLVVVLTWLGAGDIVDCGVAGGNYGYALMWIIALAIIMRFLFVSLIAKYQLCNQHGEGVLDGLARLHPWYAPFLAVTAVVMGHIYGSYMSVGIGEASAAMTGMGKTWQWALFWSITALLLVFRPEYPRLEFLFKLLLAVLAGSFLGLAVWVGPNPGGILRGTLAFALPEQEGPFDSLLLAVGLMGAVGGSLMNLAYPYFIEQKGWRGPQFRRLQMYDFLLAIIAMIVLDLSVWTLGAELIHGSGEKIADIGGLANLLGHVLGETGRFVFYLGVFAAIYTSLVGHAAALGLMTCHGYLRWKAGTNRMAVDYRRHPLYRPVVVWVLISPLVWTLPGMPDFVTLTLVANSLQVVLVPPLAGGLWWITADRRFIGEQYRNRWWENAVMAVVFGLALWGAWGSVKSVTDQVKKLLGRQETYSAHEESPRTAVRGLDVRATLDVGFT